MSRYLRTPLQVGDRVRIAEDESGAPAGGPWVVTHVSRGSVTIVPRGKRVQVTVPVKVKGRVQVDAEGNTVTRTFEAWEGGGALQVSPRAFVFPAEEE